LALLISVSKMLLIKGKNAIIIAIFQHIAFGIIALPVTLYYIYNGEFTWDLIKFGFNVSVANSAGQFGSVLSFKYGKGANCSAIISCSFIV